MEFNKNEPMTNPDLTIINIKQGRKRKKQNQTKPNETKRTKKRKQGGIKQWRL